MEVEFSLVDSVEVLTLRPDPHTVIGRKATEEDRQTFRASYRAFKAQADAPAETVAETPPAPSRASALGPDDLTPAEPSRRFFDKKKKK